MQSSETADHQHSLGQARVEHFPGLMSAIRHDGLRFARLTDSCKIHFSSTGVAHAFRGPLTLLTYGPNEHNEICYYPRSNKIGFFGVGVIGRIEKLDYWDGEPPT